MHDIQSVLRQAAELLSPSSDSALLDAEIILCKVLDRPRSHLRAWPDKLLTIDQFNTFQALLNQRFQGTPIAYLTGTREFWSRDFHVSPDVLIPRPDTELLIELSLNLIPVDRPYHIIDLGTGSGIIAITIAAERPLAKVWACDASDAALNIAKRNAAEHGVDNVAFFQSNWFSAIPEKRFDFILSNPPYIASNDSHLQQGDLRFEPFTALCAEEQGLADIRIIVNDARHYLKPNGHLLIEHGYDQQPQVQILFEEAAYQAIETFTDLAGHPRATYGRYRPNS